MASSLPEGLGAVLELGSGGGFFAGCLPGLIPSEIFYLPFVKIVLDGQRLPFSSGSLCAIVMIDVLHHLPIVREFFAEAARCALPGDVVTMIEPWATRWSRLIYNRLHKEPFLPGRPLLGIRRQWTALRS